MEPEQQISLLCVLAMSRKEILSGKIPIGSSQHAVFGNLTGVHKDAAVYMLCIDHNVSTEAKTLADGIVLWANDCIKERQSK